MERLFIAYRLDSQARDRLVELQDSLERYGLVYKRISRDNFHLTAAFLGRVKEEVLPLVKRIVEEWKTEEGRMVEMERLRGLPANDKARSIAVIVDGKEKAGLEAEVKDLRKRLDRDEVWHDRKKFLPHITVGRDREGVDMAVCEQLELEGVIRLGRPGMFRSTLTRNGTRYEVACR